MIRYISKGEWFDKGTEALLVDNYRSQIPTGLFRGYRNGQLDEEVCTFDEFDVVGEQVQWSGGASV